jgi:2-polyprenyl-6-methoxyphenol hydroxylase-like FAD-dependent oxidoreductase
MAKKKVIVIGAGIGGLSAAVQLAYRGFDVTVLEKTAAREVEAGKQFGALLESKIGLAAGDQWELFESSD